ncbi:MAG: sialate O-acetylesterase, partial [Clostridia bacterium]|nr:sialate O-acetylesterase [Clostridia bacterium]
RSLWAEGFNPLTGGGTGLLYYRFLDNFTTVYNQLKAKGYSAKIKGMVWMQGCAELGYDVTYEPILNQFISDIREDLQGITGDASLSEMPFVIGKIATSYSAFNNPHVPSFNAMQQRVADSDENVYTVETSDLIIVKPDGSISGHDAYHFAANDMLTLGKRFGNELLAAVAAQTENDFEVRGGSIKYDSGTNDDGMRIHVRMTESMYTESIGKEVGVLIIPEYDLDGGSLTYATDKVLKVVFDENDWDDISEPDTASGETETDKEAITSLIYKQNGTPVDPAIYNAVILARGYIKDGDNITYTNVWGKSIADIALDFIDDEEHAEELDAYLNTYTVKFYDTDGTTVLDTQSVKYGSEFNAYEKEIDGTEYQKWYKKASDGSLAAEEYDFNATGAKVVKKNLKYQVRVFVRTVSFDSGLSVSHADGTVYENDSIAEYNEKVFVTVTNTDKTKVSRLYVNGSDSGYIVVNGTQKFSFNITEKTNFSVVTTDLPITFRAENAADQATIEAHNQGINGSGYLVGPNINKKSVTDSIKLDKDTVFETTLKLGNAYNFGFTVNVGEKWFGVYARPWNKTTNFCSTDIQILNNGMAVNYALIDGAPNDTVKVKLIFDSENGKIYLFANGTILSDAVTVAYSGLEQLSVKFNYLAEADTVNPGYFADWKILSGKEAVENAIEKCYYTDSYNGTTKTNAFIGVVDIKARSAENGTYSDTNGNIQSTLFDGTFTADSDTYEIGLQFVLEGGTTDSILYFTVTSDQWDAYTHATANVTDHGGRTGTLTASREHRIQLKLYAKGAIGLYFDGVLVTGQFMNGFGNTKTEKFGKYNVWIMNRGTSNFSVRYIFGGHKITASDITGT